MCNIWSVKYNGQFHHNLITNVHHPRCLSSFWNQISLHELQKRCSSTKLIRRNMIPGLEPSSKIWQNCSIFPCLKYSLCIKAIKVIKLVYFIINYYCACSATQNHQIVIYYTNTAYHDFEQIRRSWILTKKFLHSKTLAKPSRHRHPLQFTALKCIISRQNQSSPDSTYDSRNT